MYIRGEIFEDNKAKPHEGGIVSKYNLLVNRINHLPSYILNLSCVYFTTNLAQSS